MKFVISQALNNTTIQVNLNNMYYIPSESDVTMSIYNSLNGKLLHTYMHTLNRYENPDTISLDPIYTYKIIIHTVPEVIVDSVKLIPGKHNIINASTPTGELNLKMQGSISLFTGINSILKN